MLYKYDIYYLTGFFMEDVQKAFNKAKVPFLTTLLWVVSIVAMFLPFYSFSVEVDGGRLFSFGGVDFDVTYFDIAGITDLLILGVSAFALFMAGMITFKAYNGSALSNKSVMQATLVSAAVALFNIVVAGFVMLTNKERGADFAYGFFLFMAANILILGMNAYKANMQKDYAKEIMNEAKGKMKSQVDGMKSSGGNSSSKPMDDNSSSSADREE
jgi:hypothetical protein